GLGLLMDIHVVVSGDLSVREGHVIAHFVDRRLKMSDLPVHDVIIHIEPD
ncbi:MAG: cation-efflux pump, partial [Opitutaceae bacterium]|nr:cation-efflux pump [Opitutaceae bacterium]